MTISKKLLLITSLVAGNFINAVSLENFDTNLLTPYVEKAQSAFRTAHETIQWLDHGPREILVTGKPIAKKLYKAQKAILKDIKKELKHSTVQLQKNGEPQAYLEAQQLYKAFKHLVYKSWKKNVKARYQETKKSNDPHAWGWIHNYKLIED
jgi:hypothetical protein